MSYCVNEPPTLKLCDPFSMFTVSATSRLFALRDWGEAVAPGLVSPEPTDGKFSWYPFWFATAPVYMPVFSSLKKLTGEPLYPTRASLTRLLESVDRTDPDQ